MNRFLTKELWACFHPSGLFLKVRKRKKPKLKENILWVWQFRNKFCICHIKLQTTPCTTWWSDTDIVFVFCQTTPDWCQTNRLSLASVITDDNLTILMFSQGPLHFDILAMWTELWVPSQCLKVFYVLGILQALYIVIHLLGTQINKVQCCQPMVL